MKIELSSVADAISFEKIDKTAFAHVWDKKEFEEELTTNGRVYYKIKDKDEVIGYIGYNYVLDCADIVRIAIDKEYRQKGYGKQLLLLSMQELQKRNIKTITLEVNTENKSAIKLYESSGFHKIATRKKYYDNTFDAIIYQIEI